jgi:DNA-binding Xre family transcriptional regulator
MKNNIKNLRKKLGLTMAKLAEEIGTSQQQVDRLEKGKRKLSAEWIDVLCRALKCKPGELVEFSVNSHNATATANGSAIVLGAIETKFGNNLRELDADEQYEIRFKPSTKDAGKEFFALIVEGGNYLSYPDGTELIFTKESESSSTAGLQENADNFAGGLKSSAGAHKFSIADKIVEGRVIKSIRSE